MSAPAQSPASRSMARTNPSGRTPTRALREQTYRDCRRYSAGHLDPRQQQGERVPLPVRASWTLVLLQHQNPRRLRSCGQYHRHSRISDASRTPTFSEPKSATSSLTISPGPSAGTIPSLACDFNYLPIDATFTVNYGGVYDFGTFSASSLGFTDLPDPTDPTGQKTIKFPDLSPVQSYGAGCLATLCAGPGQSHTIHFPTSRWACSGRIPGTCART